MKKRILCLLLAVVMLTGLLPVMAAEGSDDSQHIGTMDFTYNGDTYTLAVGHLEGSDAIHLWLDAARWGFEAGTDPSKIPASDLAISIFQNPGTPQETEFRNLTTTLIKKVTYSVSGGKTTIGETAAPKPATEQYAEKDRFWTAPLNWAVANESGTITIDIVLEINSTQQTHRINLPYEVSLTYQNIIDCTNPDTFPNGYTETNAIDTMEELNNLFRVLELPEDESVKTRVILAPVIYRGILDLSGNGTSSTFRPDLVIEGSTVKIDGVGHCATAIIGGIRLGMHGGTIRNLYLQKSQNNTENVYDSNGRACGILTNGGEFRTVESCVFEDYDIGLANQNGYTAPHSFLVFRNCKIGVQITANALGNNNPIVTNNQFLNCSTGMQIDDLPDYMSNYSFRIFNCDFLDNDTDINCGIGRGYLYCYGNFYGTTNGNDKIIFRNAKGGKGRIKTNPRWTEPISLDAGQADWTLDALSSDAVQANLLSEAPGAMLLSDKTNYITVDQSEYDDIQMDEVTIPNGELAYQYTITDPYFYERTKPLLIHTITDDGTVIQELGTWAFRFPQEIPESVKGTSPNFNPYLEVTNNRTFMTVRVENSTCLPVLSPTLSIPCPADWQAVSVSFDGEPVESSFADGAVTFPVKNGGTYTIQKAEAPAPDGLSLRLYEDGFTGPYLTELDHGFATSKTYGIFWNGEQLKDYTVGKNSAYSVSVDSNGILTLSILRYGEFCLPIFWGDNQSKDFWFRYSGEQTYTFTKNDTEYTLVFGRLLNEDIIQIAATFFGMDTINGMQPVGVALYTDYANANNQAPASPAQQAWITDVTFSIVKDDNHAMSVTTAQKTSANWWKATVTPNSAGDGYVQAEIALEGEENPIVLSMAGRVFEPSDTTVIDCATLGIDTWEKLQTLFQGLQFDSWHKTDIRLVPGAIYDGGEDSDHLLELVNCEYGTTVRGSVDENGNPTTIIGGVKLMNLMTSIEGICFLAPEAKTGEITMAVTHGAENAAAWWIQDCAFIGYDVAVDCAGSSFTIPSYRNFFIGNDVALRINCGEISMNSPNSHIENSVFLYNNTAVQVKQLPNTLMRHNFRIQDCDFLNNTLDFEVPEGKPYYFHKNYFGDTNAGLASSRPAKVTGAVASEISYEKPLSSQGQMGTVWWQEVLEENDFIVTPQLMAEVSANNVLVQALQKRNFSLQQTQGNQLQICASSNKTELLKSMSKDLIMDGTNLPGMTIQINDIVGETDTAYAVWSFPNTVQTMRSNTVSPGKFHPGIEVMMGNGYATIRIQDSPALTVLHPTLSGASLWDKVQILSPDRIVQEAKSSASSTEKMISFRVTRGGDYRIQPYDPLSQLKQIDQGAEILIGQEYIGKQLLVASYGEGQQYLGMTSAVVPERCILPVSGLAGAKTIKVFLVDDLQNMIPLTEALPIQ